MSRGEALVDWAEEMRQLGEWKKEKIMYCKQCGGEMEDTQSRSSGTGEKIFRCTKCGWTGVESVCLTEILKTPKVTLAENVLHNGIKYAEYKAIIKISDANGELKAEYTTWRADIITGMMEKGMVLQAFEPGDTFSVEAAPYIKPDKVNS